MIRISFIAPTSLIKEWGNRGDFHLALAHLLEDQTNEYEEALRTSKKPIYLDNGLFENGESVPLEELLLKAIRLDAQYVFVPDVLFNKEATEENVEIAYQTLEKMKKEFPYTKVKLAAVVQADNKKDYLQSYSNMVQNPKIDLIGLSILAIPKSYEKEIGTFNVSESRLLCLRDINDLPYKKHSHLLGAGSSYVDVAYAARNCPWVVSHDSSSAIWNAIQGHYIQDDGTISNGKTKVHVDFKFKKPLTKIQEDLMMNNIEKVLNYSFRK